MIFAVLALRWALAAILVSAGAAKVGRRTELAKTVAAYEIIPGAYQASFAATLPSVEIAVGVLLASGVFCSVGGFAAASLFASFALAIAVNLGRGRRFDCGCGGFQSKEISWLLVVRNLALACLGVAVALGPQGLTPAPHLLQIGASAHTRLSDLLPVPLLVLAGWGMVRCAQSYGQGRLTPPGPAGDGS